MARGHDLPEEESELVRRAQREECSLEEFDRIKRRLLNDFGWGEKKIDTLNPNFS